MRKLMAMVIAIAMVFSLATMVSAADKCEDCGKNLNSAACCKVEGENKWCDDCGKNVTSNACCKNNVAEEEIACDCGCCEECGFCGTCIVDEVTVLGKFGLVVEKLNGNKNNYKFSIIEVTTTTFCDGNVVVTEANVGTSLLLDNNMKGSVKISGYTVSFDVKGNTDVRALAVA